MSKRRTLLAASTEVGLLALCVASAACNLDLERMLDQRKQEAYESDGWSTQAPGMRRPPAGSVHRQAALGASPLLTGLAGSAFADEIPLPVDDALLRRGEVAFRIYCQVCHGVLGDGRSQVAENMTLRKPPSLHEPRLLAYPPGRVFRVISDGYGLMPSYSHELGPEDRWAVIAYVEVLQLSQRTPLAGLPDDLQQEALPWLR